MASRANTPDRVAPAAVRTPPPSTSGENDPTSTGASASQLFEPTSSFPLEEDVVELYQDSVTAEFNAAAAQDYEQGPGSEAGDSSESDSGSDDDNEEHVYEPDNEEGDPDFVEEPDSPPSKKRGKKRKAPDRQDESVRFKKKAKGGKPMPDGVAMANLDSLLGGTDVFANARATETLENQPVLQKTGNRQGALASLVASMPLGSRKQGQSDRKFLNQEIRENFARGSVMAAEDGNWSVKGMRTTLKHFQVLGVASMRGREKSKTEPRGGILADEMGLGKTVMMLANITAGKREDKGPKATLIVAPPGLMGQWASEIEKHVFPKIENKQHGIGQVIRQHGRHKKTVHNTRNLQRELERAGIVLTTYGEVRSSFPTIVVPSDVPNENRTKYEEEQFEKHKGFLHRINWFRVVLDEAHAIKNRDTNTSKACCALLGKYRWVITGTPIMNRMQEFFPYFAFLREPHVPSMQIFNEQFRGRNGEKKLQEFIKLIMIRRTHGDRLFNAKLVDLPPPSEHVCWVRFNNVERQIYNVVVKRFRERVKKLRKDKGLTYQHGWELLIRLRQLTSHILLAQSTMLDCLEREDYDAIDKIAAKEDEADGARLLLDLRERLDQKDENISGTTISDLDLPYIPESDEKKAGGSHGRKSQYKMHIDSMKQSQQYKEASQRVTCCYCHSPPSNPQKTSCDHIYCLKCLDDICEMAAHRGQDQAKCVKCLNDFHESKACDLGQHDSSPSQQKEKVKSWLDFSGQALPSAKTMGVKSQILNWIDEDPDVKIIVFTQFLGMVEVLSKMCTNENWPSLKYTGRMTHLARESTIGQFKEDKQQRVLLASLTAGGIGLNLTMASRVICVDPWWNSSVEQQAFCRVFRLGQTKETSLVRLLVKGTVDEVMHKKQKEKRLCVDGLVDDPNRNKRLSVDEIIELFGDCDPFDASVDDTGDQPATALAAESEENAADVQYGNEEPGSEEYGAESRSEVTEE